MLTRQIESWLGIWLDLFYARHTMLNRILIVLLVLLLPLQSIAAAQMTLCHCHSANSFKPQLETTSPHAHWQSQTTHQDHNAKGLCADCVHCDLCSPSLTSSSASPNKPLSYSRLAESQVKLQWVMPSTFDRPPKPFFGQQGRSLSVF